MLALLPFFIFIFSRICSGYVLRGFIDDRILPLSDKEVSLTTVQLLSDSSNGELPFQETYLRDTEGNFIFSNVSAGEYLVVLNSGLLETRGAKLKVTISPEQVTVNRIFDGHDYKSDVGPSAEYPLVINPVFRPQFVAQRESFSIFNFLKSPMNLMMIASLAMVFVFPKLMEGIGMCEHCHKLS